LCADARLVTNQTGTICPLGSDKRSGLSNKYCDEAYAIFDAKNRFKKTMINKAKVTGFLKSL